MGLKDKIANTFRKLRERLAGINWKQQARQVARFMNRVMHKILFEWLMPKKYRGLKKKEIFEIIFKSDTPAGKKFDVWLLVAIIANIVC